MEDVWSDAATLWTSLSAGAGFLAVARLSDDDRLQQARVSAQGELLDSASAAAPRGSVAVVVRALGEDVVLVVAWSGGRQPGRLSAAGFELLHNASAAIAGPIQSGDGPRWLAVDTGLARFEPSDMLTPLQTATPILCLGRYRDQLYACTREGLQAVAEHGLGELSFDLAQLLPPATTHFSADVADACDLQWQHFRFDLLSLGITAPEPATAGDAAPSHCGELVRCGWTGGRRRGWDGRAWHPGWLWLYACRQ